MLSFDSREALLATLALPLDPELHHLLTLRIEDCLARGLADMTHIVVIEEGDTEADIIEAIGFSPLVNRIHGDRFGDPDFMPDWDWRIDHRGWIELGYTVGDSGFAYILFIPIVGPRFAPDNAIRFC